MTNISSVPPHASSPSGGPAGPYEVRPQGLFRIGGGQATQLTTFSARIVADIVEDDALEQHRVFEIDAELTGRNRGFQVSAADFSGLRWVLEHLGPAAVILPGCHEHARAAIQLLSGDVPQRRVYTTTGWRNLGGVWAYLHGSGAIGPEGPILTAETRLPAALAGFVLPAPPTGDALIEAVRASWSVLDIAPDRVTVPLFSAVWRAVLGPADFAPHVYGPTNVGKTALAAVFQQHFGPALDDRHLPGSWSSTANALESLAFFAKDALLVVDDLTLAGGTHDAIRLQREVDRLLRAQGNQAGRQRLRADLSMRVTRWPRGILLSTGEDTLGGESLHTRVVLLELRPSELNWAWLTVCQGHAAAGLYAQALAAFVQWLAPRYGEVVRNLSVQATALRDTVMTSPTYRRTAMNYANLALGFRAWLDFAQAYGVLTAHDASGSWERAIAALRAAGEVQARHQLITDPITRFLELLRAALASGRAHLASAHGHQPSEPQAWGWRLVGMEWRPQGDRVGWVESDDVYLEPEAAYAVAQRMAQSSEGITVRSKTLHKRLHDRGLLVSTESDRGHLTVRRVLEGRRRPVLHLRGDAITPPGPAFPALPPLSEAIPTPEPDQPNRTNLEQP